MRLTRRIVVGLTVMVALSGLTAASAQAQYQDTILNRVLRYNSYTGEFDTLIAAVLCADPALIDVLDGGADLTVFLPTDYAFSRIGLNPQNVCEIDEETLTDILLYHATPGYRSLQSLTQARFVPMANGLDTVVQHELLPIPEPLVSSFLHQPGPDLEPCGRGLPRLHLRDQ